MTRYHEIKKITRKRKIHCPLPENAEKNVRNKSYFACDLDGNEVKVETYFMSLNVFIFFRMITKDIKSQMRYQVNNSSVFIFSDEINSVQH